jgi:hypothetical protein
VISVLIDRLQRKRVERAPDRLQSPDGDVKVSCRSLDVGMSKQNLDRAKISAGIERMRGGGMAEQVRMDAMFDAGPFARLKTQKANRTVIERRGGILPEREQPVFRSVTAEVNSQSFEQRRGESNLARNASLALKDMQHHAFVVDVAGP